MTEVYANGLCFTVDEDVGRLYNTISNRNIPGDELIRVHVGDDIGYIRKSSIDAIFEVEEE